MFFVTRRIGAIMFDNLSDKLDSVFRKLKGHGKLTEKNIEDGLKEVRMALLEADVHFRVVKKLIADIRQRALGQEVMASLTPGQQVIKVVNDELTTLMGSSLQELDLSGPAPVCLMMVGTPGVGQDHHGRQALGLFAQKRAAALPGPGGRLSARGHRPA